MEKIRKIAGWLLIMYALVTYIIQVIGISYRLSEPSIYKDVFMAIFTISLLWLGVSFIRKKFNKDRVLIVSTSLIILFIPGTLISSMMFAIFYNR